LEVYLFLSEQAEHPASQQLCRCHDMAICVLLCEELLCETENAQIFLELFIMLLLNCAI
jgi:hypothetical protein